MTDSESRVRDANMADEYSNFQKHNILLKSAQSILGQVDKSTQGFLELLS